MKNEKVLVNGGMEEKNVNSNLRNKLLSALEVNKSSSYSVPRICTINVSKLKIYRPPSDYPCESTIFSLALKLQGSKRILRSNNIRLPVNTLDQASQSEIPALEIDLALSFTLEYPHHVKRNGNKLQIVLQRRKHYKNKAILGYKRLASATLNLNEVLKEPFSGQVVLTATSQGSSSRTDKVDYAALSISEFRSWPTQPTDPKGGPASRCINRKQRSLPDIEHVAEASLGLTNRKGKSDKPQYVLTGHSKSHHQDLMHTSMIANDTTPQLTSDANEISELSAGYSTSEHGSESEPLQLDEGDHGTDTSCNKDKAVRNRKHKHLPKNIKMKLINLLKKLKISEAELAVLDSTVDESGETRALTGRDANYASQREREELERRLMQALRIRSDLHYSDLYGSAPNSVTVTQRYASAGGGVERRTKSPNGLRRRTSLCRVFEGGEPIVDQLRIADQLFTADDQLIDDDLLGTCSLCFEGSGSGGFTLGGEDSQLSTDDGDEDDSQSDTNRLMDNFSISSIRKPGLRPFFNASLTCLNSSGRLKVTSGHDSNLNPSIEETRMGSVVKGLGRRSKTLDYPCTEFCDDRLATTESRGRVRNLDLFIKRLAAASSTTAHLRAVAKRRTLRGAAGRLRGAAAHQSSTSTLTGPPHPHSSGVSGPEGGAKVRQPNASIIAQKFSKVRNKAIRVGKRKTTNNAQPIAVLETPESDCSQREIKTDTEYSSDPLLNNNTTISGTRKQIREQQHHVTTTDPERAMPSIVVGKKKKKKGGTGSAPFFPPPSGAAPLTPKNKDGGNMALSPTISCNPLLNRHFVRLTPSGRDLPPTSYETPRHFNHTLTKSTVTCQFFTDFLEADLMKCFILIDNSIPSHELLQKRLVERSFPTTSLSFPVEVDPFFTCLANKVCKRFRSKVITEAGMQEASLIKVACVGTDYTFNSFIRSYVEAFGDKPSDAQDYISFALIPFPGDRECFSKIGKSIGQVDNTFQDYFVADIYSEEPDVSTWGKASPGTEMELFTNRITDYLEHTGSPVPLPLGEVMLTCTKRNSIYDESPQVFLPFLQEVKVILKDPLAGSILPKSTAQRTKSSVTGKKGLTKTLTHLDNAISHSLDEDLVQNYSSSPCSLFDEMCSPSNRSPRKNSQKFSSVTNRPYNYIQLDYWWPADHPITGPNVEKCEFLSPLDLKHSFLDFKDGASASNFNSGVTTRSVSKKIALLNNLQNSTNTFSATATTTPQLNRPKATDIFQDNLLKSLPIFCKWPVPNTILIDLFMLLIVTMDNLNNYYKVGTSLQRLRCTVKSGSAFSYLRVTRDFGAIESLQKHDPTFVFSREESHSFGHNTENNQGGLFKQRNTNTGLLLEYDVKEKKQKFKGLGKKSKDSEAQTRFQAQVQRIVVSSTKSIAHPLKVMVDGVEWDFIKFFQISSQWQTHVKTFPLLLYQDDSRRDF